MKIIVNNQLIETEFIYKVSDVRILHTEGKYDFCIYFLNEKEVYIELPIHRVSSVISRSCTTDTLYVIDEDAILKQFTDYVNKKNCTREVLDAVIGEGKSKEDWIQALKEREIQNLNNFNECISKNIITKAKLEALRTKLIEQLAYKHISNIPKLEL